MNVKWFALSIGEIEKKLKTNAASGLSRKAARSAWYKSFHKTQTLFIDKRKSPAKMFLDIISDFALIFLLFVALLAILFDERDMGITVLIICAFGVLIAFSLYYKSQRAIERLNTYFKPTVKVIRGGKLYRTSIENIVSGDVILLEKGDIVPGDARIVTSDNLTVSMRLHKNKYVQLKKQAQGIIAENENNPQKLTNILHAGSVIEEGSGRAIVYAVGRFTYLGAMTGGIVELYNDNIPRELKNMRKICSKISFFSMLCILPLSIVSLLLSHLNGGNATLSFVFLTALALCVSAITQFSVSLCKIFFIKNIKELSEGKNAVAVRTTDAFDKLTDLDYIFLLDGSALTDGILHFEEAFSAEGCVKSFDQPTSTLKALLDMAALYSSAETSAVSTAGINAPQRFNQGINEFLKRSAVDFEALKIRYPIKSFIPSTQINSADSVIFADGSQKKLLSVSFDGDIFSKCNYAFIAGKIQPLSAVGADKLKHTYNMYQSKGKSVLTFSLSNFDNTGKNGENIFIGCIVLGETVDKNIALGISALESNGIKTVSFISIDEERAVPQIPFYLRQGLTVQKSELLSQNLPLTHRFGEISVYYDFDDKNITSLIEYAHKQNKSVGVISFSDLAPLTVKESDVFISCSSLIDVTSAKSEKELYTLELAGAAASVSCMQSVKSKADIILQRPNGSSGGISSLLSAFYSSEISQRNLNSFFKYAISAQFIRILTVILPMLFGKPILDARHVLVCSFLIDILVLLMFAVDKTPVPRNKKTQFRINRLKKHIENNKKLMCGSLISGLAAVILPFAADLIGIFGPFLYRVEYMFPALLLLHIAAAYYTRYGSIVKIKNAVKNKFFVLLVSLTVIFVLSLIIISSFGLMFDMISYPITYFIMSFIPSVIFSLYYELA